MKERCFVSLLLLLIPLAMCAQPGNNNRNERQAQVDALAVKLSTGLISRVEILQIPARILTRTRITPEMIERQFEYKLTIRSVRGGMYENSLAAAARSILVQPQPEIPDLRWAAIFYGVDDTRIASMYFDRSGRNGALNNAAVSFQGDFFKWLDNNFGSCFK
jgi:hypothetical protein